MAYSITKPNIYFSGDKRILTETVASGISKFNVVMTHAKDSMYYVINDSTKDTIEIAIEPFKTDTNCVLTNYIMFPNDFSDKTISFVAPDGYEIYYTGDYTRAKYTENTIIAIQHVDMDKIVISINAGEKEYKYGVLLTLSLTGTGTMSHETTVTYNPDGIDTSKVKLYWNYNPETDELGERGENTHTYRVYPDNERIYHLLVLSNEDLKFPAHSSYESSYNDISNYLIEINKYKNCKPILVNTNTGYYFVNYKKLQKIVTGIFDPAIADFGYCFYDCSSLTSIPDGLFDNNGAATSFNSCFYNCSSLTSIPDGLFDNNTEVTSFQQCFYNCSSLTSIPDGLFDNNTEVTDGFIACFHSCSSLASIPGGLFDNNGAVTSFQQCFANCSSLASIPGGLFDNNGAVTSFQQCFVDCSSLASIPGGLFDNNTEVTSFQHCFASCSSLASIPGGLFDNNTEVTNFMYCFGNCSNIRSNVPDLWNSAKWPNVRYYTFCFLHCINAGNYPDIPDYWK